MIGEVGEEGEEGGEGEEEEGAEESRDTDETEVKDPPNSALEFKYPTWLLSSPHAVVLAVRVTAVATVAEVPTRACGSVSCWAETMAKISSTVRRRC